MPLQFLLPFYWLLLSIATLRALHELLDRPFYWDKTEHRTRAAKTKTAEQEPPLEQKAAAE